MERTHARDLRPAAIRAALKTARDTTTQPAAGSYSLLKRGANLARSLILHPRCVSTSSLDTCEKPASSSGLILGILIAVGYVCTHG